MFWARKKDPCEDRPVSVQIETTSRCNARCEFCHHPAMKRPKADMTDEVFAKIIRDLKELKPATVIPFLHGEMFLDKKIFERMGLINRDLPEAKIQIFTNAALLTEDKCRELSRIKNISLFHVSLNAFDRETYARRTGLVFERTVENVQRILALNAAHPFLEEIHVSAVEHGKEHKAENKRFNDRFVSFVRETFPRAVPKVGYKYNYLSRVFSARRFRDIMCPRLKTLCVLANGLVCLCCMDMEGEYLLGNANERSLLEIYNSPLAREYRTRKKSAMVPCRFCNMI